MISYSCPICRTFLTAHDSEGGTKRPCPVCGQRLLVPASRPANRTVLGRLESAGEPSPVTLEPVDTGDYDDPAYPPPRPRIRRAVFWRCLFCGERVRPVVRGEISQTGWIVFIVVLLFFFPLCWIGLLMKEEYRFCPECGCKLGSTVQTSFG